MAHIRQSRPNIYIGSSPETLLKVEVLKIFQRFKSLKPQSKDIKTFEGVPSSIGRGESPKRLGARRISGARNLLTACLERCGYQGA